TPDSTNLFDIVFMDSLKAFAVGIAGVIYRYDHPVVGISGNPVNAPVNFRLAQNYPNPFNPQTTIFFELETSAHIRLTIFDAAGRQVRTLIDAPQNPGEHRVFFDGSRLASGVYFYQLSAISPTSQQASFSQTRKMLLLK
ncbi:MAG: T9SS type A sorting domain-containing protein, partial [Calditrichaeota bacterium]|nr:T9SS type A sorting domain-containing protein [Calditrichota bacterium]